MSGLIEESELSTVVVRRVSELFNELQWPIEADGETTTFDRFCQMLELLQPSERELLLELTRDFRRYSLGRYDYLTRVALQRMDPSVLAKQQQVIILPLVSPKERHKAKSGGVVVYICKGKLVEAVPRLRNKVHGVLTPDVLGGEYSTRQDALILLVDDFIGSGKTALEAVDDYLANWWKPGDSLALLSLVAQKAAADRIRAFGLELLVAEERTKGISESARISDTASALALMDQIEERLKVSDAYRRGFGQSEALVCMQNCPNNTFPIYWTAKKHNGRRWPAPFPRG